MGKRALAAVFTAVALTTWLATAVLWWGPAVREHDSFAETGCLVLARQLQSLPWCVRARARYHRVVASGCGGVLA